MYNTKFGKPPLIDKNAHRELLLHENLNEIFCWKEQQTVSYNLAIQYNKVLYLFEDNVTNRKLARKHIMVYDYPDGNIELKYGDSSIPYSIFHDRLQTIEQGDIVENKQLGNVLAFIQEKQSKLNNKRSKSCPRKK